ncbi:ParB/RepB/Spo0J family partition protein [Thermoanaerobacterium sp. RBIITD]|uniref:ParB/RepB/Spo0J family partition protein n=1 Tax=Thermoanaerobacterium sp. RBIITD TaxID=1550240 RepID=UPI000BB6AC0B|nr:ParB/RepB/Spo0J family partition protein [Thermoanaerobacterium sp. RBIITD]SNX53771.1 chromosome partitioning protein, ParB family [Thermoanaerobacterium sp. RBIITD]
MNSKRGLGRGLQALIPEFDDENSRGVEYIKISDIEPNQYQPRRHFNDESLQELSESIKENGVIQPIIVRKIDYGYQIVAGERRWRAAKLAGLKEIPALVKEFDDQKVMEIALIENLQREDLNPIDEAKAYKSLIEQFNLTQEEISKRVGKSRSAIANSIRLLNLNDKVQEMLIEGKISIGHAKVILAIQDLDKQNFIANKIIDKNLNVRETENLIKQVSNVKKKKKTYDDVYIKEIEDNFCRFFGTKVKILPGRNKGKIMIEYYGEDDLSRLTELIINKS